MLKIKDNFGLLLKDARLASGLSLTDLANQVKSTHLNPHSKQYDKIATSTLRAYESGSLRASFPIIKQFSEILNKPTSYFCDGTEDAVESSVVVDEELKQQVGSLRTEINELRTKYFELLGRYSELAKEIETLKSRR